MQPVDAMFQEPDTPPVHHRARELKPLANCAVWLPGSSSQHNARESPGLPKPNVIEVSCERPSPLNTT
jgi:hypothetical protein